VVVRLPIGLTTIIRRDAVKDNISMVGNDCVINPSSKTLLVFQPYNAVEESFGLQSPPYRNLLKSKSFFVKEFSSSIERLLNGVFTQIKNPVYRCCGYPRNPTSQQESEALGKTVTIS
jgi:hypothetical protein